MITDIHQLMALANLAAYGTSEGATKGWEMRERYRQVLENHGFKKTHDQGEHVDERWYHKSYDSGTRGNNEVELARHGGWRHFSQGYADATHGDGDDPASLEKHLNDFGIQKGAKDTGRGKAPKTWVPH